MNTTSSCSTLTGIFIVFSFETLLFHPVSVLFETCDQLDALICLISVLRDTNDGSNKKVLFLHLLIGIDLQAKPN